MKPFFEKLASNYKDSVVMAFVDVDHNTEAALAAGISSMPTFKFYKGGNEIHTIKGADEDGLKAKIDELKWFLNY